VRTLLHGGDASMPYGGAFACGITCPVEQDVARGKVDVAYLNGLPRESRVFTTHHTIDSLPCAGMPSELEGGVLPPLPPGVKVIHPVSDPFDTCINLFGQLIDLCKCDWTVWVDAFAARGAAMPYGGWLEQNKAWWDAHVAHPEQVLWLDFDSVTTQPETAVRAVASFLGVAPSDALVAATVEAIKVENVKAHLAHHPKMRSGSSGQHRYFTNEQRGAFETNLLAKARAHGMSLPLAKPASTGEMEHGAGEPPAASVAPPAPFQGRSSLGAATAPALPAVVEHIDAARIEVVVDDVSSPLDVSIAAIGRVASAPSQAEAAYAGAMTATATAADDE